MKRRHRDIHIEKLKTLEQRTAKKRKGSRLERIKKPKKSHPKELLQPVDHLHMLKVERGYYRAPMIDQDIDLPPVPDICIAIEDYNSVDYQIIVFNLWRSKAKRSFF